VSKASRVVIITHNNEEKSAASFCREVAASVLDMFCNFYSAKNHKIAKNSTTTKAKVKISTDLEALQFWEFFNVCLVKFKASKFCLIKLATDLY
jgi:hypothetical protein